MWLDNRFHNSKIKCVCAILLPSVLKTSISMKPFLQLIFVMPPPVLYINTAANIKPTGFDMSDSVDATLVLCSHTSIIPKSKHCACIIYIPCGNIPT